MAKKRVLKKGRVILLLSIVLALALAAIGSTVYLLSLLNRNEVLEACAYDPNSRVSLSMPLNSNNYIITKESGNGVILYAKGENEMIYPASLTKIMTMMVVLDHALDINETLTVTYEDLEGLIEANASVYGLEVGDSITLIDALYGLILESGADCANLLRRYVEEQGYDFIELMNEKANTLGMTNSHFSSVTGLHEDDNYTTVYDLLLLAREAMKNDNARAILTTLHHTSSKDYYTFDSTLSALGDEYSVDGYRVLGGKTGFTLEAHLCIFALVESDEGDIYFIILANADESGEYARRAHMIDVRDIIETYFTRW